MLMYPPLAGCGRTLPIFFWALPCFQGRAELNLRDTLRLPAKGLRPSAHPVFQQPGGKAPVRQMSLIPTRPSLGNWGQSVGVRGRSGGRDPEKVFHSVPFCSVSYVGLRTFGGAPERIWYTNGARMRRFEQNWNRIGTVLRALFGGGASGCRRGGKAVHWGHGSTGVRARQAPVSARNCPGPRRAATRAAPAGVTSHPNDMSDRIIDQVYSCKSPVFKARPCAWRPCARRAPGHEVLEAAGDLRYVMANTVSESQRRKDSLSLNCLNSSVGSER